ncbi:Pyrimidine-specific ribonucleoside hydrolase RihA [Klebsiella pneumoniae]|nr:Pyrimidine-specific ribonucleoside hydrolase RihA [Klebsiella pneumoniae]
MVFQSGIPVVMAGLDVTHKAQILPADIERFRQIGNPVSTIVAELLDFFMAYHKDEKWGFDGAPLHDPCTIAWLLKPVIFTTIERWVGVETEGKYTQGMTVVDYYHLTGNRPNTTLMLDVDREAFVDLLAQRLAFTPDLMPALSRGGLLSRSPPLVVRRDADHHLTEVLTF